MVDVPTWLLVAGSGAQALAAVAVAAFTFQLLRIEHQRQRPKIEWCGNLTWQAYVRAVGPPADDAYTFSVKNSGWHSTDIEILLQLPNGEGGLSTAEPAEVQRYIPRDFLAQVTSPDIRPPDHVLHDMTISPGQRATFDVVFSHDPREHISIIVRPVLGKDVVIPIPATLHSNRFARAAPT